MTDDEALAQIEKRPFRDRPVEQGSKDQFEYWYGRQPKDDAEFLDHRFGYASPGSTVSEQFWERQLNGPMTIITEGTWEDIPLYESSDL